MRLASKCCPNLLTQLPCKFWPLRDEERDAKQRDIFFSQGCLFFTGTFVELGKVVKYRV
jgi:hypothetical protein